MTVVVVSNRGPVSFAMDADGRLVTKRAGGGLAASLAPAVADTGATWVACAMSDADKEASAGGEIEAEGFRLRLLSIDPAQYRMYYDVVSSGTLWYLYHNLFDTPRRPRFDRRWREAWEAYRAVNLAFAEATAEVAPQGATVLVHDFHLSLVGTYLAERRRDVSAVWFSHTPFCEPMAMRMLPDAVAGELLGGMAGYRACGFHTDRWADAYTACSQEVLGMAAPTYVTPAAADADDVRGVAAGEACANELARLEEVIGDRKFIVRVDRIELSKNILRGFYAFEDLLEHHPEWRERVVFGAFMYPSREGLADYLAYRQEVEALVDRINETWSTPTWTPILHEGTDNFPRSIAALRRADVLLVNPVRDGLNLVAKEGSIVNERAGVLALSREAGAWEELSGHALPLNPFDVSGTADMLCTALEMPEAEREKRAAAIREIVLSRTPHDWFADQMVAADRYRPSS
jgi:trehalose 6-phosphate synthase